MTVFKKVMVADRLPKDGGHYYTDMNELYFEFGNWHDSNYRISTHPEWWLEEVELPSDEQVYKQSWHVDYSLQRQHDFKDGANYILNKLK